MDEPIMLDELELLKKENEQLKRDVESWKSSSDRYWNMYYEEQKNHKEDVKLLEQITIKYSELINK